MIPSNIFLAVDMEERGTLYPPDADPRDAINARSLGYENLNSSIGSSTARMWKLRISNSGEFLLSKESETTEIVAHSDTDESAAFPSFCFDQNMRPLITYEVTGGIKLFWYDPTIAANRLSFFQDCRSPRILLDDKRDIQQPVSEVALIYFRGANLYLRRQLDRYAVEYLIQSQIGQTAEITGFGLSNRLRLQIEVISGV